MLYGRRLQILSDEVHKLPESDVQRKPLGACQGRQKPLLFFGIYKELGKQVRLPVYQRREILLQRVVQPHTRPYGEKRGGLQRRFQQLYHARKSGLHRGKTSQRLTLLRRQTMKLDLEAKTKEQELVKAYLEENASEVLAEKINNGVRIEKDGKTLINKKTLDGFMKYASDEARKLASKGTNSACVEDKVVYSWAVHYFEEDAIEGTLYNEDGSEYKPAPKVTDKPVVKPVQQKKNSAQISMFDFEEKEEQENKNEQEDQNEEAEVEEEPPTQDEINEMLAELADDEKLSSAQEVIDVETGEIISESQDKIISKLRDILGDCFIVR